MSFFGLLLLFLLGYFVIWPLLKLILGVRRVRRQFNDAFAGYDRQARQRQPQPQPGSRQPGWTAPRQKKKKIDSSVGEYVEFQDIQTTEVRQNPDGSATATAEREQQIVDVKWEDIK